MIPLAVDPCPRAAYGLKRESVQFEADLLTVSINADGQRRVLDGAVLVENRQGIGMHDERPVLHVEFFLRSLQRSFAPTSMTLCEEPHGQECPLGQFVCFANVLAVRSATLR